MDGDFKDYEREYLERINEGITVHAESHEQRKARLHGEHLDDAKKAGTESKLDSWDYAVLDMIRRENLRAPMKFGTLRTCESLLKLHCHGLIRRLDRRPTFDEMERTQAFLDSAAYKQYEDRLKRIMTNEVAERLELISEILGTKRTTDLLDLTDKGKDALKTKRVEIVALYEKMSKQYVKNRTDFYEMASSFEWALPMLVTMGFAGPMMMYMLASSDAQYGSLVHSHVYGSDFGADFDADGVDFGIGL